MIDPSAYTLQTGQALVSGLDAVVKAAAEYPGPARMAVAAGSRPGAWMVEAFRDREVLRRVGVELALTMAERDAGVAAVEAWLGGAASILVAGAEGSGPALAALHAWPTTGGERGAAVIAACEEAEIDLWRAAARWTGRVLLEPADLQELKDWTALCLAGDERNPGPTIVLAPSRLRRSGALVRCGFPQNKLGETQRAARADPPSTGLDDIASLPQLGETAPIGLASIGPASTVLRQALVELGLAGRLPVFRAASVDRVDPQMWDRMRQRCQEIAVFDCGRDLASALRILSGVAQPASEAAGAALDTRSAHVLRGVYEVNPDRPADVAARVVELVRDHEASSGEALRKLVRARAEAVAIDPHRAGALDDDATQPSPDRVSAQAGADPVPLRSSIGWLLRESGFEVVSSGGLAQLASLGRGERPEAWPADALRVADGSLAASLIRSGARSMSLVVVVDLGYTPPGVPGFDLRRLMRRFETQLGPVRRSVLTAEFRPSDDRRSLRLLDRLAQEAQTAVLFADRPEPKAMAMRLRYLGVPTASAQARAAAIRADPLHRGASVVVGPSLLGSPGRSDVVTTRLPLAPSLAQGGLAFAREATPDKPQAGEPDLPEVTDPAAPLHAQRARWWSCLAGAEHQGPELAATVLAEAGRRHGYRVLWLREALAGSAGSRWHVSFSRDPDPKERRAGGSGHWDPATPPSCAAWSWAGAPALASSLSHLTPESARSLACVDLSEGPGVSSSLPVEALRQAEVRAWARWAVVRLGEARWGALIWLGYALQRGYVPLTLTSVEAAARAVGGEPAGLALRLGRCAATDPGWAESDVAQAIAASDPWYDPDPSARGAHWATPPQGLSASAAQAWGRGVMLLRHGKPTSRARAEIDRYRRAIEAVQRYAQGQPQSDDAFACTDAAVSAWPLLAAPYGFRRFRAGLERGRTPGPGRGRPGKWELRLPAALLGQSIEWRPRFGGTAMRVAHRIEALSQRLRLSGVAWRRAHEAYDAFCLGLGEQRKPEPVLKASEALPRCRAPLRLEVGPWPDRGVARRLLQSLATAAQDASNRARPVDPR